MFLNRKKTRYSGISLSNDTRKKIKN